MLRRNLTEAVQLANTFGLAIFLVLYYAGADNVIIAGLKEGFP